MNHPSLAAKVKTGFI